MLNLTPYTVNINGNVIAPSGAVARIEIEESIIGSSLITSTPIVTKKVSSVVGLPADSSVPFLVTPLVLSALGSEYHLIAFCPDNETVESGTVSVNKLITPPK